MNHLQQLRSALIGGLLLVGSLSAPGHATITGNPATDGGWIFQGTSAGGANYNSGAANYNVNLYATAFTLDAGSLLLSNFGGFDWSVNDVVVGIGGVFSGANTSLTYNDSGATSTRIVAKYGTAGATWLPNSPVSSSPGYGSLEHGGVGSILLGTFPFDFSPANAGSLVVPTDSPLEQTGPTSTTLINGNVGRVITQWSGGALTGFESFLDLTLLNIKYPGNGVALGNKFILDLQNGTGSFQNSQGTLPSAAPEPNALLLLLAGSAGLALVRRRTREGTGGVFS